MWYKQILFAFYRIQAKYKNLDMNQKTESEQFSHIINPEGVKVELFSKACEEQQLDILVEFILSIEKILKLYERPGRSNPFAALSPQNFALVMEKLKTVSEKLKFTMYEIKIRLILETLQRMGPTKMVVNMKQEEQQNKKLLATLGLENILAQPEVLNSKFSHPRALYEFAITEVLPQAGRQILSLNDHEKRYEAVLKGLNLCSCLIHPTQLQIQISKNTLLESRLFKMKYEYIFQGTQTKFIKKAANIINQALLCPADCKIQATLLKLLKRMYRLWGQLIHNPLFLNLRNISLFFTDEPQNMKMLKEASIFCYSVINSKTDIKFADILSSSEDLNDLRRNQHFSSKGLALPFQLGSIYDTVNLELPIWKYRLHLDKRQTFRYSVIIQKSNTLLYWKFDIVNYDIGFGIYKVNSLKKYQLDEYNQCKECKSVLKLAKYGNGTANSKMPTKGQLFLKTGLYHIVFDNSHSMVRGKQLSVQICQLQSIL